MPPGPRVALGARLLAGALLADLVPLLAAQDLAGVQPSSPAAARTRQFIEGLGRLPLRFERNEGQAVKPPSYRARGLGYTVYVTSTEMVLSLPNASRRRAGPGRAQESEQSEQRAASTRASVLRVKLLGARSSVDVEGIEELAGSSNYFLGSDPKRWRRGVTGYSKVRCRGVYPGIDLVYHGREKQLEYDFVVAPGADPRRIRLAFEGARSLRLDGEEDLVVAVEGGEVVQRRPRVYQRTGQGENAVRGRWALRGAREARFEVGAYDTKKALVIDPVLVYSTYLGGSALDEGLAIAVDGAGSAYVTGRTLSADFPTQNPYQMARGSLDVFVTKLAPSGESLMYSTYLGGGSDDYSWRIAVDGSGSAFVTGATDSADFPVQSPYQVDQESTDVFVTKLSPSGDSLVYSTYLGGSSVDNGYAIAVDGSGSAYVTGDTLSADFPTLNPYQTDRGFLDAFVTKLAPSGSSLAYSTYLGGSFPDGAWGIAVDDTGSAYIAGQTGSSDFPTQNPYQSTYAGGLLDAFVAKLAPSGGSLVYSTYLGGSADDHGGRIALDGTGSAYVTGFSFSADFPTQNPYQASPRGGSDVFVTKLAPLGSSLVYSTYLGGSSNDYFDDISVDGSGSAHVVGSQGSSDFPTHDPNQACPGGFVTKLGPAGNGLEYSTCLRGGVRGVALDGSGNAYVTGEAFLADFPTQNPYQMYQGGGDGFVTKLGPPPPTGFFTVTPCRLIDTRTATGPYGGPALAAGADRIFTVAGQCGISSKARSVAVNIAVTQPTAPGHLRLYAAGAALPQTSSINYGAGQTRASNAIVLLTSGGITVRCNQPSGSVHLILDVSGYFE